MMRPAVRARAFSRRNSPTNHHRQATRDLTEMTGKSEIAPQAERYEKTATSTHSRNSPRCIKRCRDLERGRSIRTVAGEIGDWRAAGTNRTYFGTRSEKEFKMSGNRGVGIRVVSDESNGGVEVGAIPEAPAAVAETIYVGRASFHM